MLVLLLGQIMAVIVAPPITIVQFTGGVILALHILAPLAALDTKDVGNAALLKLIAQGIV